MNPPVVILSGPVRSGKTQLTQQLENRAGAVVIRTMELVRIAARLEGRPTRKQLQDAGHALDVSTGGSWVRDALLRRLRESDSENRLVVVDSARTSRQIHSIRQAFGTRVVHLHLSAPASILRERFGRTDRNDLIEPASFATLLADSTESAIESLADIADIVIDTARCTPADVYIRALHRLRLAASADARVVDVLVGGEYGSEGKGQVSAYLAREYDLLIRVGGPNAGHKVMIPGASGMTPFTYRSLPSGTLTSEAKLLIGPGAVINVAEFLNEVTRCRAHDRLFVDPNVMTIEDSDRAGELKLKRRIGSTAQGVGAATVRRIGRSGDVTLAKDVSALQPFLRPARQILEEAYSKGKRILLEGTQGFALSLYHGSYPYVTSRDTTVAGTLSEAGVAPSRVRRVILTCRTYPIRVGNPPAGTSGPMSRELTWNEIARRSHLPLDELLNAEKGSVSGTQRRVAEFDWELLHYSALLNRPTDIALSFVDYIDAANRKAQRFEQLTAETIRFVEEIETVAQSPVSLISTRFDPRAIIDRRRW